MYKQISTNKNHTILLMFIFFGVVAGIGWFLSYYYNDPSLLWFAVIFSLAMNWFSYFFSDKLALASVKAKPANEESNIEERQLVNIVENLSITAGLPMPKVYVIPDSSLNAFATGRNPKHATVAVTTGLLAKLDKAELEGVIAHELAHIQNYDILLSTVVITLVGAITLISDWIVRTNMFRSNDSDSNKGNVLAIVGLVLLILSPIFAQLIQLAISRRREFLADASGSMLTRYPEGLAKALEKLEQHNQPLRSANRATAHLFIVSPFGGKMGAKVASLFSTHPPTEARIKALRNMASL